MNEQTIKIYGDLLSETKSTKTRNLIFCGVILLFFVLAMIGTASGNSSLMTFGLVAFSVSSFAFFIVFLYSAESRYRFKKSVATLERTGSIKYIGEILNKQYQVVGNVCFSRNMFYIPGKIVVAYCDVKRIFPYKGEFVIETLDGKNNRVRFSKEAIAELSRR